MKKWLFLVFTFCSGGYAFAQPAVRDEPRHHNVFENNYVRVLDVYLAPHDTTQFHIHSTPSVFVGLTNTATVGQLAGQQPVKSDFVAGRAWYDSLVTPRIHRVWTEDTTWFHVMDVELTGGKPQTNEPVLQHASLKLLFDEPLVKGYTAQLSAKENFKLPSSKAGYLLISFDETSVTLQSANHTQQRLMKAGHYSWINEATIVQVNDMPAHLLILQLR